MYIVLAVHHFLPTYAAGAELYTYRLARWLLRAGHTVQVVCVESIDDKDMQPRCVEDVYDGIPVYRLHFNLTAAPDPLRWQYWNPEIGVWFNRFLTEVQPHLVHINSCYLLSASVITAARELGLPIVLSLHDFWFLCPRVTLQKPDGSVCRGPDGATECAWCLATERRRYRLPDVASHRILGRLAQQVLRQRGVASFLGWQDTINTLQGRQQLLRETFAQVDVVISGAQFLATRLIEQGFEKEKIQVIRYGLDISSWTPVSPGEANGASLRIAYIGQIAQQKGVHILIQAFNRLTPSANAPELRIYGEMTRFPRYAARLRRFAARNDKVAFTGTYDNKDTPGVFAGIDVLVVPSTWYEGSPLVIAEALATKTPVIASNLGGMVELVHHGVNGLVFEPGSVEGLAEQLQRLLDDAELLARLRGGIAPARTIDDEMTQIMGIYDSLVSVGAG